VHVIIKLRYAESSFNVRWWHSEQTQCSLMQFWYTVYTLNITLEFSSIMWAFQFCCLFIAIIFPQHGLQIWLVTANIMNKYLHTAFMGWSYRLQVVLTTQP
jgi:hypothetical protein